jgi:SAM-dependent methyltransferase
VLEIGCGQVGGFVPALLADGYEAIGIDPAAPTAPEYRQLTFEQFDPAGPVDAVVASTSLHHVEDLDHVLDRILATLAPRGTGIVIEWAWERFDEATAQWCFSRLAPTEEDDHRSWLQRHCDGWAAAGQSWHAYFKRWTDERRLHPGGTVLRALDVRFDRRVLEEGPYFFCDLDDTAEADEQAAIDANVISATGLRYAASRRTQ